MKMRNTVLSVIIGLGTLGVMAAAETQQQPEVGKPAPDFSLTTGDGSQVGLKDYRGKWIVLYFYPKDFTSGCTMEARNFQRDLAKYEDSGAVILGVSVDTAQSHKDFCTKEGLNFKLLAQNFRHTRRSARCSTPSQHGHEETAELREQIESMPKDELN